jgi:hypothetical protein
MQSVRGSLVQSVRGSLIYPKIDDIVSNSSAKMELSFNVASREPAISDSSESP